MITASPSIHRITLAAILVALSALTSAEAQRPFQKSWQKIYDEQKEPAPVDDKSGERDLDGEIYIFGDPLVAPFPYTGFPSTTMEGDMPSSPSLAQSAMGPYAEGAMAMGSGSPAQALRGFEAARGVAGSPSWISLRLAQSAMMVNDLARAQGILEEILATEPENHRALLALGELAMVRQRFPDARDWYLRVRSLKPRNIEALEMLCQISYEFYHDMDATKTYSREILLIDDKNPQAMLWQAEACAFTGEAERAADYYAQLIRSRPQLMDRVIEVGRRLSASGKPQDALVLYQKALLANPTRPGLLRAWEQAVRLVGGEEAVKSGYRELSSQSGNDLRVYDIHADYLRRNGQWEDLLKLREECLAIKPDHVPSILDFAYDSLRRGDFAGAEPHFKRALEVNPLDPDVHRQLGQAYGTAGYPEKARAEFRKAMELNPRDITTLEQLARLEEQLGDREAAEALLRQAISESPANGQLLTRLGQFYLRGGERIKARELLQQALATTPDDADNWVALAEIYFEDNDQNALRIMDGEVLTSMANNSLFFATLGQLAASFGDHTRARAALERALTLAPGDLLARGSLAETLLALNQPALAIKTLEEGGAHATTPEQKMRLDALLAAMLHDVGRYDDALGVLARLIKADPTNFVFRTMQLEIMIKQGQADEANRQLNEVVRALGASHPRDTQFLRAKVLRARDEDARAVALLRQLAKEYPDDGDIQMQLAMATSDAGNLDEAEGIYRALMGRGKAGSNPWFETAANNLGYLFAQKGIRLDEAEKLTLEALALNPRGAYILDSVGVVYLRKGDTAKAREYLERAARISPRDPEIHTNLGELYEKLGEQALARQMYEKALATDPKYAPAKERMEALAKGKVKAGSVPQ